MTKLWRPRPHLWLPPEFRARQSFGTMAGQSAPPPALVGFDGAVKSIRHTLSNGDLTITNTGGQTAEEGRLTRSKNSHSSGKRHVRVTLVQDAGATASMAIGFGLAALTPDAGLYLGEDTNGLGLWGDGTYYYNGGNIGGIDGGPFADGAFIDFNYDFTLDDLWARANATGNWNQNPSADPVTGTLGFDMGGMTTTAAVYIFAELENDGQVWTMDGSGTHAASGFTGWDV